ncbi:rhomboid family intramembrane serine protease [bacterium]|nr:rhomboid family intramembrane serine protease [bacterium]
MAASDPSNPSSVAPDPAPPAEVRLQRPVVAPAIMALCVVGYGVTALVGKAVQPDVLTLLVCGAKDRELVLHGGEWWRLLMAGFLHGGILHIVVNLYALRALGPLVEKLWGWQRFLLIYIGAVVVGNVVSLFATAELSVGASGGVFGLFGAVVVFSTVYRRFIRPDARRGLWVNLVVVVGINAALGITVPFIDNGAHVGGLATGLVAALVLRPVLARRPRPASTMAVRVAAFGSIVLAAYAFQQAAFYVRGADWVLLARTEMVAYSLDRGALAIAVPRGWEYRAPTAKLRGHSFQREGMGLVRLRMVPPAQAMEVAAYAKSVVASAAKDGATLLRKQDAVVLGRQGVELLFKVEPKAGQPFRLRNVIFPSLTGGIVDASLASSEAAGFRLDLLFDLMVHSIHERGERPRRQSPWEQFIANPRDPAASTSLAAYYLVQGRAAGAESLLRLALAIAPGSAEAHDLLAYLYATAKPPLRDPSRALRHARRALALKPDTSAYLATLAIALEASGDPAEALAAATRAAALAPDDARYADLVRRLSRGAPQQP